MHMHLLKVRDVLFSSLPPFASTASSYDPTAFSIGAGTSLYASVAGSVESPVPTSAAAPAAEDAAEEKGPPPFYVAHT